LNQTPFKNSTEIVKMKKERIKNFFQTSFMDNLMAALPAQNRHHNINILPINNFIIVPLDGCKASQPAGLTAV
jgi:hypothetical protein